MVAPMTSERHIVCAWFPNWPLETWTRARRHKTQSDPTCDQETSSPFDEENEVPFVLLVTTSKGDLVHGVNETAARFGLAPGQRATDASAAHDNLAIAYADPDYEAVALNRLAAWSRRWTPHTRTDGVDGVAMDLTGCTHLFGGYEKTLHMIGDRLAAMGLTARLAMAPNHAAAHALSRHGSKARRIIGRDGLHDALAGLPVSALRIDPASITLLRRLGLKTIGDVARIPRPALKKRFGARTKRRDPRDDTYDDYLGRTTGASDDVLARVDEIVGRVFIPLNPERPEEPLRITRGLVEPVMQTEVVLACLRPLVDELMGLLIKRDEGVVALGLEAFRADGGRSATVLRLSRATRQSDRIMRLLIDRLGGWHAEFGFDALAVEAVETAALPPQQEDSFGNTSSTDLHALIDRLRTRLGPHAVLHPVHHDSHIPERAFVWTPQRAKVFDAKQATYASFRPERMFDVPEEIGVLHALPEGPPARFIWRRQTHDVTRVAGPERIAPEWWRERSTVRSRDYYSIETGQGRRYWIYREGFTDDERGVATRWFMHGLFS